MKLATWNINSVRARNDRLHAWVAERKPDVLCLQEIKVEDSGFPTDLYRDLGYHVATLGQRTYNGVAILSRTPLDDIERGFGDGGDESQSRFLAATTAGLRVMSVYVPNGQGVGTEKYLYKLGWMKRLTAYLAARLPKMGPAALCGDFNVAPTDLDVHDPVRWREAIMCSTPERQALSAITALGLVDVLRKVHPEKIVFTWWDYRMLAFPKNKGLRIDHLLCTPDVAARVTDVTVEREQRKGDHPSDHVPVVADLP